MKKKAVIRCYFPMFLSVLLLLLSGHTAHGQDPCLYEYQTQPPSSVDCNPYENTAILKVQCSVLVSPASATPRFEIQWFHNDILITEDSFSPLDDIVNDNTMQNGIVTSEITLRGASGIDDTVFSGDLYCQLAIDGNVTLTLPSSSLILGVHDDHIVSEPCRRTNIYSEASITCAGRIDPPPTMSTTTDMAPTTDTMSTTEDIPSATPSSTPLIDTGPSMASPTGVTGSGLQDWVYVLVAIAAVFGMIIVVLAILCVGLCLKKNKTTDSSFKQNGAELKQFATDSMISNGIYQHKAGEEDGITSGTHKSSHTQISDYNTLGERDYEVINAGESHQPDYHHLQRPSPPMVPNGRSATFQFSPTKEFHSMSTLTSQLGKGSFTNRSMMMQHGMMDNRTYMDNKSASEGPEDRVYQELEQQPNLVPYGGGRSGGGRNDIYRSPTDSTPPDSARSFNRGGSYGGGQVEPYPLHNSNNPNESLYTPKMEDAAAAERERTFTQSGLGGVPETGSMFPEPVNPTSFPVHKYEKVPSGGDPQYETPIVSRKNSASVTTMSTTTAPSSSLSLVPPRSRSRTDSGTRYETEIQQRPSQYHKLTRHQGGGGSGLGAAPVSNSQSVAGEVYSELIDTRQRSHGNEGSFSTNMADNSERQLPNSFNGGGGGGGGGGGVLPYPPTAGMMGGNIPNTMYSPPQSTPSSLDSLNAYIERLQADCEIGKTDNQAVEEAAMIKSATMDDGHVQHRPNGFRESRLEGRGSSMPPDVQRTSWRGEAGVPDRASLSSFSGEDYSHLTHNQEGQGGYHHHYHQPLSNGTNKMNWLDSRGGEYERSKTMV